MKNDRDMESIWMVIGVAGVAILFAMIIGASELGLLGDDTLKRLVGVVMSGMLIIAGNYLPKLIMPLGGEPEGSKRLAQAERLAGRVFVIAGLAAMAIWIFAPVEKAQLAASLTGLAAILLGAANWLWLYDRPAHPPGKQGERQ